MSAEDESKAHFKSKPQTQDHLGFDENPFDRYPFNPVLEQVAQRHTLDLGIVRGSLTYLARMHWQDANREGNFEPKTEDLAELMQAVGFRYSSLGNQLATYLKSNRLPVAEQRRYIAVMGDIAGDLTQTGGTDWAGYLAEEMNSAIYRNDGVRSISPTVQHLTISTYEAFSAKRSKSLADSQMVGLGEALPQEYPSDSLSYPNVRGDRMRHRQQWVIVEATETNRVNRKRPNVPPSEPSIH